MTEQASESRPLSPGAQLRAAREKAGLSVRDVADKLHQLPRQVEALENDDYQQFNAEFFCRSYLKAYGTLLGLDIQTLLDAYTELRPESAAESFRVAKAPRHIQQPSKGRSVQYWGAAATVLIMIILWWFSESKAPEPGISVTSKAALELGEQAVIAPAVLALPVAAASSTAVADFERVAEPLVADNSVSPALSTDITDLPVDEGAADLVADGLLRLQFSGDCWVQVKDSNEVLLFADLKRATETLELTGQAPFYIVLGYAPAVTVIFNGELVTVPVNEKNNSARFVVGQS